MVSARVPSYFNWPLNTKTSVYSRVTLIIVQNNLRHFVCPHAGV